MLVCAGIKKTFGSTKALRGVDIEAARGSVVAVLGQNGAGKSTLMNVLAGVIAPDEGSITLEGKPYRPTSPHAARKAGVMLVHQELSLCPHLSVAENVYLGEQPVKYGVIQWEEMFANAARVLEPFGGDRKIDPRARVSELSPASQQLVEIARNVADPACRVLLLDEPTSSLAAADVERLFAQIRALKERGLLILYLSHYLEEVKAIADRYTVLRDGATVGAGDVADASIDQLVELMAGRPVENLYPRSPHDAAGEPLLRVDSLAGEKLPKRATLEVRRGEVVGVAGLVGAGRTEMLRAIFGLDPIARGTVKVGAFAGPGSPMQRLAQGAGLLSEDRKGEGLATALSIADNMTLSKLGGFMVSARAQDTIAKSWIDKLKIKARSGEQKVMELSGGNQQKVALARLLHHDVDLFLLDEPTRGIDVESKAQIYDLMDQQAKKGKGVLIVSSYLPELLGTCDRIHVMRRGELGPSHDAKDVDETTLLHEAVA